MNGKGKYILELSPYERKKQKGNRKCLLPRSNNCTTEKKRIALLKNYETNYTQATFGESPTHDA